MIPTTVLHHKLGFARLLVALAILSVPALLASQDTEASARRIEARFVSPCCWQENLAVHGSQVADELRALIAGLVRSGQTEPQIVDYMVARFGERILREPRGTRFRFLNSVPLIAGAFGFIFVVRFLLHARALAALEANRIPVSPLPNVDREWP